MHRLASPLPHRIPGPVAPAGPHLNPYVLCPLSSPSSVIRVVDPATPTHTTTRLTNSNLCRPSRRNRLPHKVRQSLCPRPNTTTADGTTRPLPLPGDERPPSPTPRGPPPSPLASLTRRFPCRMAFGQSPLSSNMPPPLRPGSVQQRLSPPPQLQHPLAVPVALRARRTRPRRPDCLIPLEHIWLPLPTYAARSPSPRSPWRRHDALSSSRSAV